MQTTLTTEHTLGELATGLAGASRVFQRHGLDFCCRGHVTLAEACAERGLEPEALLAEVEREARAGREPRTPWPERPLAALIEHLLERFHRPHREELPRLVELARKVERVHAERSSCPHGLAEHLAGMALELELHMEKEEQVLFPLILSGRGHLASMPVHVMEQEHRAHGENLARLRVLANDFEPPAEACDTWRALLLGLAELERDLMEHISLENNVLFPRALRSRSDEA